ncbi:MAG: hypothetical protein QOD63_2585 [Actinomycetota bacterium]|jgi:hypothetical protein|nr:hypothetical protein [Actinomycetota bacterium]
MNRELAPAPGGAVSSLPPRAAAVNDRERFLARHSIRWLLIAVFLAVIALGGPDRSSVYAVPLAVVLVFSLDIKHPLALRNLFLVYSVGLFTYGNHLLFPDGSSLAPDLLLYVVAFTAGYGLFSRLWRPPVDREHGSASVPRSPVDPADPVTRRIEVVLWLLFGVEMLRVAALIAPYGPRAFYGGQELVNRISSYGQAGSTGVEGITTIATTVLVTAAGALYADHCLRTGVRIKYRLLLLVALLPPLMSLERSTVVYGSVLLAAVYLCDRRLRPSLDPSTSKATGNSSRMLVAFAILLCAVGVAVKFGDIRAKRINQQVFSRSQDVNTLEQVLRGEFTTIVFYRDVKENIDFLGYRYGRNIGGAFVTRLVPRTIWADKPITTTEYYMRQLHPQELQAGFSLAPSLFGVGLLNFGVAGTMALIAILGTAAAYCDRGYVEGVVSRMPQFLIAATWFYSLLRDDLSTSLASIAVTFLAFALLRRAVASVNDRAVTAA